MRSQELGGLASTPADANLLRALAVDVEQPDSGYVLGRFTADRLRQLADQLEANARPRHVVRSLRMKAIEAGATELQVRFSFEEPGEGDLTAEDLPALLDTIRADGIETSTLAEG